MVRVRIAPSPTGSPHVGTAYVALFNYVFAKKHGGEFVLRIEDTDRKRLVEGAEEEILEALDWLGLKYDKGPIRQSERLDLYQKYAQELVKLGAAYEDEGAVRQKVPREGETRFVDLVRGEIVFANKNLDESVLLKSDGFPTYHLGVVVDDHLMEITHIIRGEEWVSSVPKHILLYQAFGWEPPKFAHLPLLRDPKRAKLGKRFGDVSLEWFKDEGFLPQALLNYLALLGWTHPEQKEVFDLEEMAEKFEFKDVNKAAPVFDLQKLEWMNGVYIRKIAKREIPFPGGRATTTTSTTTISGATTTTLPYMEGRKWVNMKKPEDVIKASDITRLIADRMKRGKETIEMSEFFFEEPEVDPKLLVQKGRTAEETRQVLSSLTSHLTSPTSNDWKHTKLEELCRAFVKENPSWTTKDLFMTLRIALTGRTVSPPLFETMGVLGREKTLSRLQKSADLL